MSQTQAVIGYGKSRGGSQGLSWILGGRLQWTLKRGPCGRNREVTQKEDCHLNLNSKTQQVAFSCHCGHLCARAVITHTTDGAETTESILAPPGGWRSEIRGGQLGASWGLSRCVDGRVLLGLHLAVPCVSVSRSPLLIRTPVRSVQGHPVTSL